MAGLAGVTVPTRSIRVGDGAVTLRGLSFEDLGALLDAHGDAFGELESVLQGAPGGRDADLLPQLLRVFPTLAAHAVALAADEPEQVDKVRALGAGFLQEALLAVWELTVEPAGGAKKFISRWVQLFSAARQNLGSLQSDASARPPREH